MSELIPLEIDIIKRTLSVTLGGDSGYVSPGDEAETKVRIEPPLDEEELKSLSSRFSLRSTIGQLLASAERESFGGTALTIGGQPKEYHVPHVLKLTGAIMDLRGLCDSWVSTDYVGSGTRVESGWSAGTRSFVYHEEA